MSPYGVLGPPRVMRTPRVLGSHRVLHPPRVLGPHRVLGSPRVLHPPRVLGPHRVLSSHRVLSPHRVLGPPRVLGPHRVLGHHRVLGYHRVLSPPRVLRPPRVLGPPRVMGPPRVLGLHRSWVLSGSWVPLFRYAVYNEPFRPATLFKKRFWRRCFPVNFVKFLRTPISVEHLWWLLLDVACKEKNMCKIDLFYQNKDEHQLFFRFFANFLRNSIKYLVSSAVLGAIKIALLRAMTIQSAFSDDCF